MENNNILKVSLLGGLDYYMRSISGSDIEYLRIWKNSEKEFFFHQNEIEPQQQLQWYSSFLDRSNDYMFILIYYGVPIGCMGIRVKDNLWDIYNVILGDKAFGKKGLMSLAFKSMLEFAREMKSIPITLQVLKKNPAVKWYQTNGFTIEESHEEYYFMKYQPNV